MLNHNLYGYFQDVIVYILFFVIYTLQLLNYPRLIYLSIILIIHVMDVLIFTLVFIVPFYLLIILFLKKLLLY